VEQGLPQGLPQPAPHRQVVPHITPACAEGKLEKETSHFILKSVVPQELHFPCSAFLPFFKTTV
jgi:hypothetical protein